jgi:hypothetical protein
MTPQALRPRSLGLVTRDDYAAGDVLQQWCADLL